MKWCSFLKLLLCIPSQSEHIVIERTIALLLDKSSSNIDFAIIYLSLGELFNFSSLSFHSCKNGICYIYLLVSMIHGDSLEKDIFYNV